MGADEWPLYIVNEVREWLDGLDAASHARVVQAIDVLAETGPGPGRPLVDTIHGSSIANLKELRPGSVRILSAFDPWWSSILLVAGDKAGQWNTCTATRYHLPSNDTKATSRNAGKRRTTMNSFINWHDIRAEHVERSGGEAAVEAGKRELVTEVLGHRLAEIRRARSMTQQQVADKMGVTKGRVSQIEQGKITGHDVLVRYATTLGGHLHQAIYFDDGDITAIA